jgi:hypothetical protein
MFVNSFSGRRGHIYIIFFSFLLCAWSCDRTPQPSTGRSMEFESTPQATSIQPGIVDEASGLVASGKMEGYLWTLQDSGQPNSLYLISPDGKTVKSYTVPGSANHDWEDMAVGPGPVDNTSYIYIADIGNNNTPMTSQNIIYRIPEITSLSAGFDQSQLQKITFRYPDGPRDAETVLVDPASKDILVVSKEMDKTEIYRLAYPQSTTEVIVAEKMGKMPSVLFATGGAVSTDGTEVLIRNYFSVFFWRKKETETISQALLRAPNKQLSVAAEPQGESICFDRNGDGFYTLSERSTATNVFLNYYRRK